MAGIISGFENDEETGVGRLVGKNSSYYHLDWL